MLCEDTDPVTDPRRAAIALGYLALVNSIAGLLLLGVLVRQRGAGAGASIFFLAPPVTAVMAWLVLGETLTAREAVGLVIAVVGVLSVGMRVFSGPSAENTKWASTVLTTIVSAGAGFLAARGRYESRAQP